MDFQRANPYVSCIKIRGVPIIPPLMTEDVRMEMMYYKRLAIAVEERLKNLEHSQADYERSTCAVAQDCVSPTDESSTCDSASESLDKTFNTATVIDIPKNKGEPEDSKKNEDAPDSILQETAEETTCRSWKSLSDEETNCQNDTLTLDRTASTDVATASTDINQYLNSSLKTDSTLSTVENSPEVRKPEVPKTLNIVPIIVDSRIQKDANVCEETENNPSISVNKEEQEQPSTSPESDDATPKLLQRESTSCPDTENFTCETKNEQARSLTSPESGDTTPKLVRQGSYVLESPSPMLLAHLQEEIMSTATTPATYVPTAASGNATKRKEWNIVQAKSEWELQRKKENFVVTDSSRGTTNRIRRNSASNASNRRTNGCLPPPKTGGKRFAGTRQVARSVDCIQSMIRGENNRTNSKSYVNKINNKAGEPAKLNGTSNAKSTSSVSILNLANKLGGSLGSLSSADNRPCKRTPQKQRGGCRLSKSFDSETAETKKIEAVRSSTRKLLSAVTSDKLVDVFKEIQNTHERQMTELMMRQQREQQMMQKVFEKQQMLLLAQIEQTFPGISLPRLAEKVPLTPRSLFVEKENSKSLQDSQRNVEEPPPKSSEMNGSHSPGNNNIDPKCPLDDIYPREMSRNSPAYQIKHSQSAQSLTKKTTSPPIGLYSTSVLNGDRRQAGVNRQLFPLESRTRHIPVLKKNVYEDRHIKAATVITAHAKGYLTRRLMQTERVTELKTTYKEALHCMLKLHVDAPLALPELNFHQRLQLQCDAASMNIVELFAQPSAKRMEIIRQDRQIKRARQDRPNSARSSYSFATQRTLARKKLKEMGDFQTPVGSRPTTARSRCQTWASNVRERRSPSIISQGIKRSTSAGAVRKPWR